jgi:hypothetical protein
MVKENNVQCGRVVYLGAVTEFGQVEALFNRFNVVKCVIDGMPETRASRQLAKDFPGRCWLSFFSEHQKAGPRWTRENSQVLSNRTEMCDRVHHEISSKRIVLPRLNESVSLPARHCCNVIKKVDTNEITGQHSYTYVNIGPDHAHFSLLYAILAADHDRGFEDVDLS